MRPEPILDARDRAAWELLERTALVHARTDAHARQVDRARRLIEQCCSTETNTAVMWSGGKDSTALAHLATVDIGLPVLLVSEKDDLDYPDEREYVTGLAGQWGARLDILTPEQSPAEWMSANAHDLRGDAELHSRAAGLSKACFYGLVEADNARRDAIMMGLRAEESSARRRNRAWNGATYRRKPTAAHPRGLLVCNPLSDWRGIDVYAYLLSRDVPLLPVYRCIALMHTDEPWRVRKSWWLPGSHAAFGGVVWLKYYWPSLYAQLCAWMPAARMCA